jgi:hypothetical protein
MHLIRLILVLSEYSAGEFSDYAPVPKQDVT